MEDSKINLENIYVTDYILSAQDLSSLPNRVRYIYSQGHLAAYAAMEDETPLGFLIYGISKSETSAYLFYIDMGENAKDETLLATFLELVENKLSDNAVQEITYICFADMDQDDIAKSLGFTESEEGNTVLHYSKKQIMDSLMWKKIEKLRTMFSRVKVYGELDFVEQMELTSLLGNDNFEEIDPLYARAFYSEGQIQGLMNAQEITENDVWISKLAVLPCKEANYGPVLMLASLLDTISALLADDDHIHVVISHEKLEQSFKQVLGEPASTTYDHYYSKEIS